MDCEWTPYTMKRQKKEITGFLMLAAALTLTACSEKKSAETESETFSEYAAESDFSGVLDVSGDWKSAFEKVLLKECGVKPDHYENLGNGIYEVYVEKDGKVIPYAILDSETGEYHG